ncbi:hypothetical protein [Clostridium butyricum]|uniref:hypothetical protein n=1 Tax=Clostridium butyricum TaxID=1492 RepID=UPI00374FBEA7
MFKKKEKIENNEKNGKKVIKKKLKKEQLTEAEKVAKNKELTAQQWIPIADIEGNIIYRKDNIATAMLRIQPENIDLLSDNEKRRKVDSLAEGFNGEKESIQIFCVGRPVDLSSYLEDLNEKAKMEQDFARKMVLKGYIQQASKLASSGETVERRFYVIIFKHMEDNTSVNELINRLNELHIKFTQAELTCDMCNEDELMDVLALFSNPVQAAFEKTELEYEFAPILS